MCVGHERALPACMLASSMCGHLFCFSTMLRYRIRVPRDPGTMLLGFQPPEPRANKTSFLYPLSLPILTYLVIVTKIKITKTKHFWYENHIKLIFQ